jgi:uncharacterized protein YbjT (DUF2867 family)
MILVTTAGKVGSHAARLLAAAGHQVRVVTRSPDAHAALRQDGIEMFVGDLEDPGSVVRALSGVSSVVLVTAPHLDQERNVVNASSSAGVEHIIKVTTEASADSPIARRRVHHAVEQTLAESGIAHTLLRSNAYMQNILLLGPMIAATSRFSSPAAAGRIGMIDARDVAAAAVAIAGAAVPAVHAGKTYRLSGPDAISYDDVADRLTSLLGRPVLHEWITTAEQEAILLDRGMPAPVARANAQALSLFAEGDSDWVTTDIHDLLGRPPVSFADFAAEHGGTFARHTT